MGSWLSEWEICNFLACPLSDQANYTKSEKMPYWNPATKRHWQLRCMTLPKTSHCVNYRTFPIKKICLFNKQIFLNDLDGPLRTFLKTTSIVRKIWMKMNSHRQRHRSIDVSAHFEIIASKWSQHDLRQFYCSTHDGQLASISRRQACISQCHLAL